MNHTVNPKSSNHSGKAHQLKKIILPISIIVIAIAIFMLMKFFAPQPEKKAVLQKALLVNVLPLTQEDIQVSIYSQGNISPIIESTLTAEVVGSITYVSNKFASGGYFAKGETLLRIDNTDYAVALIEAKARFKVAKAALLEEQARVKQAEEEWRLSGKSLSSAPVLALREPQLQKAEADVELAEAAIKSANTVLSRTIISAPYNGIIKNTEVDLGQYVNAGSTLATIFSIESAKVRLPIKSQDIKYIDLPAINEQILRGFQAKPLVRTTSIKEAFNTVILSNAINHEINTWQVALVGQEGVVDTLSRVQYVVAVIDDPYNVKNTSNIQLPIGSYVNAEILGKTLTKVTRIPRSAVIGKNTVYLLTQNNTLDIQSFYTVRSDDDFVYTQDDIATDAKLITTEIVLPIKGMPLRVNQPAKILDRTSSTLLTSEKTND